MLTSAKHVVMQLYSMATDAIYEERRSDWSRQASVVATTRWLQRDQTLPLFVKGVACETKAQPRAHDDIIFYCGGRRKSMYCQKFETGQISSMY